MKCPRFVYVIVIYDRTGLFADGVYVGSSADVQTRIKQHLHDHFYGAQKPFHDLMRKRRFHVWIVDEITTPHDSHLEYDWIDFFRQKTKLDVFNNRINQLGADWHRLEGKEEFSKWKGYMCAMS